MESRERILGLLEETLAAIREPRLFRTERGYQGELVAELKARIPEAAFPGDPIVEQEYQKRVPDHGIAIRPDLIIHIPFERGVTGSRGEGNFVAVELKRDKSKVAGAFENLRQMKEHLGYALTVLVMLDSAETFASMCPKAIARQTVCFAVRLEDGKAVVRSELCG